MKIELHILQNFPPHCLNRDDTNTPKDCLFGGFRRARISSQCAKRAMRMYVRDHMLLSEAELATRTKQLITVAARQLEDLGREAEPARAVVEAAIQGIGLALKDAKTQYLLYVTESGMASFARVCQAHWDELSSLGGLPAKADVNDDKKSGKQRKKEAKAAMSKELQGELLALLNCKKAVDLALFGRMLADMPGQNVEAACQVAHALSTNEVRMEMDFFTAVDDLNTRSEPGADMMGVVEFNSACFYRYLVIDTDQLLANLGADKELAQRGLKAFLEAAVKATPSGKQNSMAALTPPSYVHAIVRDGGEPWNLANAFAAPVRPGREEGEDLVSRSIVRLAKQLTELETMYGTNGKKEAWIVGPGSKTTLGAMLKEVAEIWA